MADKQFEKRGNKAYLTYSDYDFFEPRIIISLWEIKNLDITLLPDNPFIYKNNGLYFAKTEYKDYPLYIEDLPTLTEFITVKPPRKGGYRWNNGEWKRI
jgi:hypothetical protein